MRIRAQSMTVMIFCIVLGCFMLNGCSTVPTRFESVSCRDYDCVKEAVSTLAGKEMKEHGVTGMSIALVDEHGIIWAQGFGYADKENGIPATSETVYRVASISKLFTATAIMQLAEQGRINIDEPLTRYLPEFSIKTRFSGNNDGITPRNIMTHHSGLPANFYKGIFSRNPEPFGKVIEGIKEEYAAYPPGYIYSYSNLGMTLMGSVIERVSGKDFVSYMDESMLRPLGMANSSFSPKRVANVAKGYRDGRESNDPYPRDLPASGLFTNVTDMARFIHMVFSKGKSDKHQIVRPETLGEMLRPQNTDVPLDLDIPVGLGWALDGMGNTKIRDVGPIARHGAAMLSFNGQLLMLTEQKLGVIVLSNSFSARPAVDKVATEALILALEAKSGVMQPERLTPQESDKPLSPQEMAVYEGYYATPIGLIKTTGRSGVVEADLFGHRIRLIPRADERLALQYKLFGLIPISLKELDSVGISRASVGGHEILLARSHSLDMVFGEKILPDSIPEQWLKRIGNYEIINAGDDTLFFDSVRIDQQEGFLVLQYSSKLVADGTLSFPISPVSDREAIILGLGGGMRETIRMTGTGDEEELRYSGYRLRKK